RGPIRLELLPAEQAGDDLLELGVVVVGARHLAEVDDVVEPRVVEDPLGVVAVERDELRG
ncbi:MAG: hypothetical protein ACREQ9_27120, partial [Candidatus Binatia bacterium]